MTDGKIIPLKAERHDLGALVKELKDVIHSRDGLISVTEAIGALELAKIESYMEQT